MPRLDRRVGRPAGRGETRLLGTPVERRRAVVVVAAFPLGAARTAQRERSAEVVADDVATLVARVGVVARVLALAETRCMCTNAVVLHTVVL